MARGALPTVAGGDGSTVAVCDGPKVVAVDDRVWATGSSMEKGGERLIGKPGGATDRLKDKRMDGVIQ